MTIIKIVRNKNSIVEMEVKGHTNYAKQGQDIVCAAVSALTQTALLGLIKHLKLQIEYHVSDEGHLSFNLQGQENEQTDAILETMLYGLQEIAYAYSKHVRIEDSRR